jgi:putative sterol carrier protein
MATRQELREALDDYIVRANQSPRVKKTLKNWSCVLHLYATDLEDSFTMTVRDGEVVSVEDGARGQADLIIRGASEDLANVFWGDENPASNYMQGAITTQGKQDDVMKLDAMAMFIYLGQ